MNKCYIIAEVGVNHNGNSVLALELLRSARESGANAVKFQSFKAAKLVRAGTETAEYQKANTGEADQFAMLRKLELPSETWSQLVSETRGSAEFDLLSSPFDEESARMLFENGMRRIKVPSGELTNHPFLEFLAARDLPLILSTGMARLEEVAQAIEVVKATRKSLGLVGSLNEKLILLHCTSNYPTALDDVNLRAMVTMRDKLGYPVGYSDHTEGDLVAVAAVAMGAVVLEKHFTLDRKLPGPDHKTSLEPGEFALMVKKIRDIERSFGNGDKIPRASEESVRNLVRRSAVTTCNLAAGHRITEADIEFLRPGFGIPPGEAKNLIGRVLISNKSARECFSWSDFST